MPNQNDVDKRIVQMEFDNEQFKRETKETIKALDRLTESLRFEDATKGFSGIENAINKIDLSGIERNVDTLSSRFSFFGNIGYNALNRISNKIIDTGRAAASFVTSLTQMANAASGFGKYEETVEATQTIMAATASEFEDTGEQMEYVSEQLDRLRWFTDETSYSFTDMASNIGKFTSAGVDLKTAVASMRGIAAWAALSGANAQKASIAMYNFSQSLGKGYMQLTDWRSLENINMATLEFKQQLIDLAIEMGKVEKVGEGMYHAIGARSDHIFSAEGMSEYLADKWFDTELIQRVLATYGDFSGKLNALGEATGFTASEMLNMMDEFREGTIDLEKYAKIGGVGVDFLTEALEDLTDADMALGEKGLRAAQETKTFSDAVNYVKDAVSSGWAKTFELIIGNEQQAIDFWSTFAEEMYDIFVKSGDDRNELLAEWNEMGGRTAFIDSIFNSLTALKSVMDPIIEGFHDIFPPMTAERLYSITERVKEFTQSLILSEGAQEKLRNASKKLFSIIGTGIDYISRFVKAISPLGYVLKDVFNTVAGGLLSLTQTKKSLISVTDILDTAVNFVSAISTAIANLYTNVKGSKALSNVLNGILGIFGNLGSAGLKRIKNFANYIINAGKSIAEFVNSVKEAGLGKTLDDLASQLADTGSSLGKVYDQLKDIFSTIKEFYDKYFSDMTLVDVINLGIMGYLTIKIVQFLKSLNKSTATIADFINSLNEQFNNLADAKKKLIKANAVKELATALAIVAGSVFILSNMNLEGVDAAILSLGAIVAALGVLGKVVDDFDAKLGLKAIAFVEFAISIGIVAGTLSSLSNVFTGSKADWPKLGQSLLAFAGVVAAFGLVGAVLTKLTETTSIVEEGKKLIQKLNLFGLAATLLSFAVGVNLLVNALIVIADPNNLKIIQNGMEAFGTIILALTGSIVGIEAAQKLNPQGFKNVATTVLSIAAYMLIVAHAIETLGSMDMNVLSQGLENVGILLMGLTLAVSTMEIASHYSANMAGVAGTILALGVALTMLTVPIAVLSKIDFWDLQGGIAAVGEGLLILGVGLLAINTININSEGTMRSAAGLLIVAAACEVLAIAISTLSQIPFGSLVKGMIAVAAEIAVMAGIGYLLTSVGPELLMVGGGLLMIAGAATLFSGAIAVIIGALVLLSKVAPEEVANIATSLVKLAPALGEALMICLASLVETFDKYAPAIAQHLVSGIVKAVFGAIAGLADGLIQGIGQLFSVVGKTIANLGGPIVDAIGNKLSEIKDNVLGFFSDIWPSQAFAAEKGAEFVEGIEEGVSGKEGDLNAAMSNTGTAAVEAFTNSGLNPQTGQSIGSSFISAITGGAADSGGGLVQTLFGLGNSSSQAASDGGLNESSGGSIADNFMNGINEAIGADASVVLNNIKLFGDNAVSTASAALNAVSGIFNGMNAAMSDAARIKQMASQAVKFQKSVASMPGMRGVQSNIPDEGTLASVLADSSYEKEISDMASKIQTQLDSAGKQGLGSWDDYVKDFVSGADWQGVGNSAGSALGEGLKSGSSGGKGAKGTAKEMSKVIEGECKVVMNETGHYIAENICAGLKEDASIEEVASGKAQNIKNAFQEVFDQLDLDQKVEDAKYKLWVSSNQNADDIQKRIMEVKNLGDQMETLARKVNIAKDELTQLTTEFGENSDEAKNAFITATELETELTDLYNQYNELRQLEPGLYMPEIDMDNNGQLAFREVGEVFSSELVKALDAINGQYHMSGEQLVENLIGGIDDSLTEDETYLITSVQTLMEATEVPILDSYDNYVDAGENLIFGFAKGITSKDALARVEEATSYVATTASETLNSTLGIESPSKVAAISGRFFDEGFALAIGKYGFMSEEATDKMGTTTIDILRNTLKDVGNLLPDNYEMMPVIKPVVDTTNVATAADYITSTFATPSSIRLGSRPDTPFNRNLRAIRLSMQDREDYSLNKEDETVAAINNLGSQLDRQAEAIRRMQVVMDSGELVGSIAGGMDQGLGTRSKYKRRGN